MTNLEAKSEAILSGDSEQKHQELATRISSSGVEAKQQACNSTGLQYTLIRLCRLPEVTQGFSKSKAWCKSAWIGTNQAAFLMLAVHTLPSQHLIPITAVLWNTLCFSLGLQNALQSLTRKSHFPYFSYFNTQVQAQSNLGEHSPEKQAGNAGQEHDF